MDVKELLGEAWKDGMTAEEQLEALKGIELPKDQSEEIQHLKDRISEVNSEAKDWKDKYRSTLDDATKKAQEAEEETKRMTDRLAQLERERAIAGYKASYLAMGYDEKLAEDTANALFDGNNEKLFENQRKHMESVEKKAREDALRGSGRPGGSGNESPDGESEAVKIAKRLGQARADADKAARAGLANYLK